MRVTVTVVDGDVVKVTEVRKISFVCVCVPISSLCYLYFFVFQELKNLFTSSFVWKTLLTTTYAHRNDGERNRIAEIVVTEELRNTKPVRQ